MIMGKVTTIVVAIVLIVSVFLIFSNIQDSEIRYLASPYYEMSYTELGEHTVEYDYKDLLRNIDGYSGKVIFVEGEVTNTQHDIDLMTVCMKEDTFTCNMIFVDLNKNYNWLKGDELSGFVLVDSLSQAHRTNMLTGNQYDTDLLPRTTEINLKCSNC